MRWNRGFLLLPLFACIVVLSALDASAAGAHTDRFDQLLPQHVSGKCVDVNGGYVTDGAVILQWYCHGGANQDVTITDYGGGWHEIKFRHSNKCLDVPGWSTENGIQLQQWTCNGTTAQRFTIAGTGSSAQIMNQNSGKCVDVSGASTSDGAAIIQWPCHGGLNQRFLVRDTYAVGLAPATGHWAQDIDPCPYNPNPTCHHLVSCEPSASGTYNSYVSVGNCIGGGGDWSTDYYAVPGSQVRFYAYGVGTQNANVTAQVWAITQTCSSYTRSQGGSTVFVDVYTNGVKEGWYAFGHLDNVAVSPGQWITSGTSLGVSRWWTEAGNCYQVTSDGGVHAHVEMYNWNDPNFSPNGYACYILYQFYQSLNSSFPLGHIGRTFYGGVRSQC